MMVNVNPTETSIPWDDPYWFDEDDMEKKYIKRNNSIDTKLIDESQTENFPLVNEKIVVLENSSDFLNEQLTTIKNESNKKNSFQQGSQSYKNRKYNNNNPNNGEYNRQRNGCNNNYNEYRNNKNHRQNFHSNEQHESYSEIPQRKKHNNPNYLNNDRYENKQNTKRDQEKYLRHISVNSTRFDNNIRIELRQNEHNKQSSFSLKKAEKEIFNLKNSDDQKIIQVANIKVDSPATDNYKTYKKEVQSSEIVATTQTSVQNEQTVNTKKEVVDKVKIEKIPEIKTKIQDKQTDNKDQEVIENKVSSENELTKYEEISASKIDSQKRPAIQIYNVQAVKGKWSRLFIEDEGKTLKLSDQNIEEYLPKRKNEKTSSKDFNHQNDDRNYQNKNTQNNELNEISNTKNSKDTHDNKSNFDDFQRFQENNSLKHQEYSNKSYNRENALNQKNENNKTYYDSLRSENNDNHKTRENNANNPQKFIRTDRNQNQTSFQTKNKSGYRNDSRKNPDNFEVLDYVQSNQKPKSVYKNENFHRNNDEEFHRKNANEFREYGSAYNNTRNDRNRTCNNELKHNQNNFSNRKDRVFHNKNINRHNSGENCDIENQNASSNTFRKNQNQYKSIPENVLLRSGLLDSDDRPKENRYKNNNHSNFKNNLQDIKYSKDINKNLNDK